MDEDAPVFSIEEFGDGTACIRVERKLDLFSFSAFEEAFGRLFDKGIYRTIVEYSQNLYSPSFGGVFLAAAERARASGGGVCLVGLAPSVRDALKIGGLESAFLFAATVDEARSFLAK